jgi:hypothetical protein
MELFIVILVSVSLLSIAAGMIFWHIRSWRSFQRQELDAGERNYRWRQFRRRMQMSVMLGLLAIAFPVGDILTSHATIDSAGWLAFYWLGVIFLACWIVLLALVDMWATRHYFGRMDNRCFVEQIKLQAELRRIAEREKNGGRGTDGQ